MTSQAWNFVFLYEAMFKIKHSLCPNMTCGQFWYKNASLFNLNRLFVFFLLLRVECAELSMFSVKQCKKCRFCMSNLCFVCKLTYAAMHINVIKCFNSSFIAMVPGCLRRCSHPPQRNQQQDQRREYVGISELVLLVHLLGPHQTRFSQQELHRNK